MTGPANKVGQSGWLGPATGVVGAMASGVGLVTQVTLWAHGCIMGREVAFPLVATHFA